jgi:hypothetical protein
MQRIPQMKSDEKSKCILYIERLLQKPKNVEREDNKRHQIYLCSKNQLLSSKGAQS